MNTGTITIKNKKYKCAFKQKARRLFMEKYGLEYFTEYEEKVNLLTKIDPKKGMSLPAWNVFSDLIITGITSEEPEFDEYNTDTLIDHLIDNPKEMEVIGKVFAAAQEQVEKNRKSSGGSGGKSKRKP